MSKKIILLQIFTVILAVGLFTQSKAQITKDNINATAIGEISRPANEAKIEGNFLDYEIKETNLEYLQSLPMPELKFVFSSKTVAYDKFPEDVKNILEAHWKDAVKYFYDKKFNRTIDALTEYKRTTAWFNYCAKTNKNLRSSFIKAPNGKRKISQTESQELWGFLNKAVVRIMDKIEFIKVGAK